MRYAPGPRLTIEAVKYGLNDDRERVSTIRDAAWSCFVQKVQLYVLLCMSL